MSLELLAALSLHTRVKRLSHYPNGTPLGLKNSLVFGASESTM